MWSKYEGICEIKAITNAQKFPLLGRQATLPAMIDENESWFDDRKKWLNIGRWRLSPIKPER